MNILVFPATLSEAQVWSLQALSLGNTTFGASYTPEIINSEYFSQCLYLPPITQSSFPAALKNLILTHQIQAFYVPHTVAWYHIYQLTQAFALPVQALNVPQNLEKSALITICQAALHRVQDSFSMIEPDFFHSEQTLYLGWLMQLMAIPGQTTLDKSLTLAWIMNNTPQGDIVEIGSAWGRSAFALAWLSQKFAKGALLCIDPWKQDLYQGENILDQANQNLDYSHIYQEFVLNLLPFFKGRVNLLRKTSKAAQTDYLAQTPIYHPQFGTTEYQYQIALLHLDGNHHLEYIRQDLALWASLVCAGGWIVLDDYHWPFGQGPQIAGDEFLAAYPDRIARAFVMEDSLYIQLK